MEINSLPMDSKKRKLIGLHRAEYERAKEKQRTARWAQAIVAILICIPAITNIDWIIYTVTVFAMFIIGVSLYYSSKSMKSHFVAERARRVLMIMHGLGWNISSKEYTDLLASFSVDEDKGTVWEDDNYFEDVVKPGYEALAKIIQQSAFFSRNLYSSAAKSSLIYFVLPVVASVIVLISILGSLMQCWIIGIIGIVRILTIFFINMDITGIMLKYIKVSSTMGEIDERLERIISSGCSDADIMIVFGEYNAAVQMAPLIPTRVFKRNKDKINRLWAQRK